MCLENSLKKLVDACVRETTKEIRESACLGLMVKGEMFYA